MKNTMKGLLLTAVAAVAFNCGNKKMTDSTKEAEKENKEMALESGHTADYEFVVKAADGGLFEVMMGEFASKNGASADIRELGAMMVKDHSKANDELKALAASKSIILPSVLGEKTQKMYDDLTKKHGTSFDKAYASAMVDDHKEDIGEFRDEAGKGKDEEIRNFASGKVAVLEHHLSMAESARKLAKK